MTRLRAIGAVCTLGGCGRWNLYCALFWLTGALVGCGGVFFYPDRVRYADPGELGIRYEETVLDDGVGPKLVTWLLQAEHPKALVVHLHGNAENMSSHLAGVYWLPSRGYDVLMWDYRGYGGSPGSASISGVNQDAERLFRYARRLSAQRGEALILWGQSIGGAIALHVAAEDEFNGLFEAIVSECAFASYRAIAREKLAVSWATLLFGYPLLFTLPERFSPIATVGRIKTGKLLIVHGEDDRVVESAHSQRLFEQATAQKEFWRVPGAGHIAVFRADVWRARLTAFFDSAVAASQRKLSRTE